MCVITDITVGYEMTTYTTIEGMGLVELCAVITNPSSGVVAPRTFVIGATTADETAGRATASNILFLFCNKILLIFSSLLRCPW